jgi:hypothetical protein
MISSPMNQKTIVLYLRMKGMALDAIHEDLIRVRGENVIAYSTVAKYVRSARYPLKQDTPSAEPMPIEANPVGQAIMTGLADYPFSSVRELSRLICLPRSTVHRRLTRPCHFIIRHLRWMPTFWTRDRSRCESISPVSCCMSSYSSARQWHDVVMWIGPGEIVPDKERCTIQSPKFMTTIVWNPCGFHIAKASRNKSNSIRTTISTMSSYQSQIGKGSLDYIDRNEMKTAPHPPS